MVKGVKNIPCKSESGVSCNNGRLQSRNHRAGGVIEPEIRHDRHLGYFFHGGNG